MNRMQRNNAGLTWVGGCAIGCGVATVLLILVIVLGMYGVKFGMEKGREEVAAELARQIQDARDKEQITVEEETVLTESLSLANRPESTAMAVFLLPQLYTELINAKGEQRAAILEAAGDYNQFLRDHAKVGMVELFEFVGEHEKLREVMNEEQFGKQRPTEPEELAVPEGEPQGAT